MQLSRSEASKPADTRKSNYKPLMVHPAFGGTAVRCTAAFLLVVGFLYLILCVPQRAEQGHDILREAYHTVILHWVTRTYLRMRDWLLHEWPASATGSRLSVSGCPINHFRFLHTARVRFRIDNGSE